MLLVARHSPFHVQGVAKRGPVAAWPSDLDQEPSLVANADIVAETVISRLANANHVMRTKVVDHQRAMG